MRFLKFERIVRPSPIIVHYYWNELVYVFNLIDPNRPKIIDNNTENDVDPLNATMSSYDC